LILFLLEIYSIRKRMDKFHISLIALVLMTLSIHTAKGQITNANELTECWKCSGSEDCGDRDSCLAEHDRCLKLKYEHDGGFVNEARCSKRTECDTEAVALWQGGPGGPWPPQRSFFEGAPKSKGR
uniref:Uncharacterized protein n=1 Tax=Clytia hemisphaerica TaxID=252671 RepID=A0A7M5UEB8_9CNID